MSVAAAGKGKVHTFSVMRKPGSIPYVIAYVTLDEGPTMMTNIVECGVDTVHIGQEVTVCFRATRGGQHVPMFKPLHPDANR